MASIGKMWRRARRDAGCDSLHQLHQHHLRHYDASGLIAAGCGVVTIRRARGHQTASVTLNPYSRRQPSAEDRTRAAAMLAEALDVADCVRTSGQV